MEDSSDDSDICEGSRNVQSVLVKSRISQEELDDYAYKRRLGDLIFDANFEAGNLGFVENVDRYEYDLMVRPDVLNTKHRIWFNFKISNQRQNQCVILTFVNISENLRLFHEGYCPVMRSRKRPNWLNLDEEQVFYYRSKNHGNRFVLSLVIRFATQDDEHQLALFYPYTYSMLSDFLNRWIVESKRLEVRRAAVSEKRPTPRAKRMTISPEPQRSSNFHMATANRENDQPRTRSSLEVRTYGTIATDASNTRSTYKLNFKVDQIAESILRKSIQCISIDKIEPSENLIPIVIILCRTNGGNLDSVASFVCQGLIDYLLSDSLVAGAARDSIDFRIFPMIRPDSICSGNSCTDLFGGQACDDSAGLIEMGNLKSCSGNLKALGRSLESILNMKRRTIIMELRVNLDLMGSRILGSHFSDPFRMEKHLSVPRSMSKFIGGFYLEACEFSVKSDSRSSSWLTNHLVSSSNVVDYYQLELSPFGSFRRSLDARDYIRYDQIAYLTIGKAIVHSLVDILRPATRPDHVTALLKRFQQHPDDADELTLNISKLH